MNDVLLGLRRKLQAYKSAGLKEKAQRTAAMIALYEAELTPPAEPAEPEATPVVQVEHPEEQAPAGVPMTPAAQALADELGVTDADLRDHTPSGKAGEFLVGDVKRIAEAKAKPQEQAEDGIDELP